MNGLPIGFYGGVVGLSGVLALASGAYAILHARNIARLVQSDRNDIVAGPRLRRIDAPRFRSRIAIAICILASCVALSVFTLIASGVVGSAQTSNSRETIRP